MKRTDRWIEEGSDSLSVCKKLESYFIDASAEEIYHYLGMHGMFRKFSDAKKIIKDLKDKKIWQTVLKESIALKKEWKGPDIPVFIFPSDINNRLISNEFNGKSGLAFKDKLFLFFSVENEESEIRSVLTHEYNHVCRLTKYKKSENDYTLLDSIILEGLAENAVRERFGVEYNASWTSYYNDKMLEKWWENLILPNHKISKTEQSHYKILFGKRPYPNMCGYAVGYYLVRKFLECKNVRCSDIFDISSEEIAML